MGLPREILQPWEPAGLNHMAEIAAASEARSYLPEPPLLDADRHALFLDLDGTLAEIAPRPRDVGPAPDRTRALDAVARRLEGAVAVLTGRSLEEADRILERALILSDSGRLTGDDFARILPVGAQAKTAAAARISGAVVPYAEAEAEFEKRTLEHALAASNGQITEAARMLRISRATFYKKLAKFGLASQS